MMTTVCLCRADGFGQLNFGDASTCDIYNSKGEQREAVTLLVNKYGAPYTSNALTH